MKYITSKTGEKFKVEFPSIIVNDGFVSVIPRNDSFDCLCNAFSFYNCINSETGKYIAFYIREGEAK